MVIIGINSIKREGTFKLTKVQGKNSIWVSRKGCSYNETLEQLNSFMKRYKELEDLFNKGDLSVLSEMREIDTHLEILEDRSSNYISISCAVAEYA